MHQGGRTSDKYINAFISDSVWEAIYLACQGTMQARCDLKKGCISLAVVC